jgi:hypothetical protein
MAMRLNILSFISGLVFLVYVFFGTGSTQLNCERLQPNQVTCEQESTNLYGLVKGSKLFFKLTGARVEIAEEGVVSCDSQGGCIASPAQYEVWLESNKGIITTPVPLRSSNYIEASEKAEQVHQYIDGEGSPTFIFTRGGILNDLIGSLVVGTMLVLINWLFAPLAEKDLIVCRPNLESEDI